ncbi:diacylglycerol O-acyltransferase 1 [Dispira parvispora]|uniref:Diacylglycerol O-acyltransferase n=1 Tax=Dispira parvispora TaxID=1520584 RepID=A0A9W8AMP5_9FUNG|nr:diacylglycerol O-acyltransferase 1 [Dispira parvispora]
MAFHFAFFNVPWERRRQMACLLFWAMLLPWCVSLAFGSLFNPLAWPLYIPYLVYIVFNRTPTQGSRGWSWLRKLKFWQYCADYFPVKLVVEDTLDPAHNYVFGYHPHGIISVGAFLNFATEATHISKLLPGLNLRLLTLTINFYIPFYREFLLGMNVASVSRNSIDYILNSGPGQSCVIVVGGASESLYAKPGQADLVLRKRLGFIKLAIKHGAKLVPCFTFGENDIYDQVNPGSGALLRSIQRKIQSYCGFTTPLFHGRGVFNYDLGLMPFRVPLVTVVGRPVSVRQNANPTLEEILQVQERYMVELQRIYTKYKDVYAKNRVSDLCFVE